MIESLPDNEADLVLVRHTANAMAAKLLKKRKQGKGGWHTPRCTDEYLFKLLIEHLERRDMIDVINFAAMIHMRRELYGEDS